MAENDKEDDIKSSSIEPPPKGIGYLRDRVKIEQTKVIGRLKNLGQTPESINDEFVKQEAIANLRIRLAQEKAEEASLVDPLTGLANRRALDDRLDLEIARLKRNPEETLTLVALDLDDFGRINKEQGESAGDTALISVAQAVKATFRDTDLPFRSGGEEMGVLLVDSDLLPQNSVVADDPAERVRKAIENNHIPEIDRAVTTSVGVTQYIPGEDVTSFRERATVAYNTAKKLGKNRSIRAEVDEQGRIIGTDITHGGRYLIELVEQGEGKAKKIQVTPLK